MKFKYLFLLYGILLISVVNAQTTVSFINLPNMNLRRGLIASSSDANSLYVCHGFSPTQSYTTEIEKYDIASQQWTIFANSTIAKRYASAEVVGYYLYIFNGLVPNSYNNKLERVYTINGDIVFLSDNPYPVRSAGNCVWNNNIYFFGGSNSSGYSNKLLRYNPTLDQWTMLADMVVGRETRGEAVNGKIYAIGGYNGSVLSRIDAYDIQTDTWEHLLNMPVGISAHSTAVFGHKIWIVGDYQNLTHIGYYDIDTNEYVACVSQNMIGRRHFGAEIVGNNLYIMGGNQTPSSSSSLNSLQYTDISTVSVLDEMLKSVKVYPNPCNDYIDITAPENIKELSINDMQGKIVFQKYNCSKNIRIDVSEFKQGTYFIELKIDDFLISKKIIKK